MKVFVFCVAILLATAVKSSPVDIDEVEADKINDESVAEPETDAIIADNDEKFSQKALEPEEPAVADEIVEGEESIPELINEDSAQYQQKDDEEAVQNEEELEEEEEKMTPEQWERIAGIEHPLCEQHTDEFHPLHLSHLTDCTKFYKCSRGRAYLTDCPSHEHWSVKLNRCDYVHIANCKPDGTFQFKVRKAKPFQASAQEEDSDQPEVGEFEIDPRCEGSDPYKPLQLRHPADCTKFYKCYMGKAYVIKCPKGQQWSQNLNRCDHPQIARCSIVRPAIKPAQAFEEFEEDDDDDYDEPTIVDDPDYEIEDPRCEPDEEDMYHPIHFAHPTDCTMFYRCYIHKAYKSQCPGGLHFNEKFQYCDYPYSAGCKAQANYIEASIMQASANGPEIPTCPQGDNEVNFAIEGYNNRYFTCVKGVAYFMECDANEMFNPLSRKCEIFTSRPQQQLPPQQQQQQQYPQYQYPQYPGSFDQNSGLLAQFPGTMDQFIEIMNQYPGMMNQFPGMNQAPIIPMRPQTPSNPNVNPPIPNTRPQQQTPEFPSWMPIPNPNVPLPEFPVISGKPTQDSSNNFNYDNGKVNSRCPSIDDISSPAHLAHETDCNKFYKCYNGRAFLMDCPSGQEWSDRLQRCDFHQFAQCDPIELIRKKIQN